MGVSVEELKGIRDSLSVERPIPQFLEDFIVAVPVILDALIEVVGKEK